MIQEKHKHLRPIRPRKFTNSGSLPKNSFGVLVGTLDHVALGSITEEHPKDYDHLFLWLYVNSGPKHGLYECAIPTQSVAGSNQKALKYCTIDEVLTPIEVPSPGWKNAELSYARLELSAAKFIPMSSGRLRSIIIHNAEQCDLIAAYGWSYGEGTGIHHVHHGNSDDPTDGALAFYFRAPGELPFRRWFFFSQVAAKAQSEGGKKRPSE